MHLIKTVNNNLVTLERVKQHAWGESVFEADLVVEFRVERSFEGDEFVDEKGRRLARTVEPSRRKWSWASRVLVTAHFDVCQTE
jgi:hypothetical protein